MISWPDSSVPFWKLLLGLTVAFSSVWIRGVSASEPAGKVVDAEGKPVAGVAVSAIGRNWADPAVSASATTGADGRFELPGAWKLGDLDLRYVGVFTRDKDGRCGWRATAWKHDPASGDLTIELGETSDVSARLVDQDGKPLANVTVTLDVLDRSDREKNQHDEIVLPRSLAEPFQAHSDDEGRFVLKGIPKGSRVRALVDEPRVGKPLVYWDPAKVSTLVLDSRLGEIKGRLVAPDEKEIRGDIKIGLRRMPAAAGVELGKLDFRFSLTRSAQVERDGRFQFTGLPPGAYFLDLEFAADAPYSSTFNKNVVLEPGKDFTPVEISLERLPVVTGRVMDEATGDGIAGVELTAFQLNGNSLQYGRRATTDAAGKYTVAVKPGMTIIHPQTPPKSHLGKYRDDCPKLEVTKDRDWPDLKLTRAGAIDVQVVDADGRPVAGAEIRLTVPDMGDFMGNEMPLRAGADGTCRLEQLDPTDKIPIRARTADAATEGAVVIRPSALEPPGKLTVTVAPRNAARLIGRVVDQRGKPVADAPVSVLWNRMLVSEKAMKGMGLGSTLDQVKTGPDGTFRTAALWPGDRYHVTIDHKPYAKAETPQVPLSVGEVRDVGTISLVESSAAVAGRVVGPDGKPIAGAEVFNRGDGPQPVSTRTAPDGSFRLEGLFAGSRFAFARRDGFRHGSLADALKIAQRKYLFVRKEGYRFGGIAVDGEPEDLTIRLLKDGEAQVPWTPRLGASFEDQKSFAKRTLEQVWERFAKDAGNNQGWSVARQMAAIDPELATAWSAQHNNRYDDEIRRVRAEVLAETDAAAAIRLLREKPGNRDPYTLQDLAERFVESAPDRAKLFAEEAARLGRGMGEVNRAMSFARAGSVLLKSGERDRGRKLIEEAAESAAKLPADERSAYTRGVTAKALAAFDRQRALALVEPITKPQDRDRYVGFVIDAIGGSDPDQALALVEKLDTNTSSHQTLKTGIAYTIAADQPDRAVRIVEEIKGYSAEKYQAEAFGWLAVAIAPKDRARAFALIDRALAMPIDKPETFGSYTYFGGGLASAAGIALNARKIGYPDMDGAMMRVIAARVDGRHGFNDPAMQTQCTTIAAPLVALLDPAVSATMLGQIEARSGLSAGDLAQVAGDWWLTAWALCDLKHAEGILEAQLRELKAAKNPDAVLRGVQKMVDILITPIDRREEKLRREIGATWRPGFSTSD